MSGKVRLGGLLPSIVAEPPGRASRKFMDRLRAVESRNVTYADDAWPVFWAEAHGANVRDADGNVYLDLTGAFGVSLLGHGHPSVVAAIKDQSGRLIHGMGDVHPSGRKVELLERLCALAPWETARAVLASSGSESMEIALKTAQLATGRPGVIAFEGGYHGLTLGPLAATDREHFRAPFLDRLYEGVAFAPFPDFATDGEEASELALEAVRGALDEGAPNGDPIGAVVIEPVQGRAGVRVAPHGFMASLSRMVADSGALLVADEIFTGFGRCGAIFASERVGLSPDILCVGKALGGGLPMSACLASDSVMDAWPASEGEAVHTSTFLGHPLSCAAALAFLDVLEVEAVVARSRVLGSRMLETLRRRLGRSAAVRDVRGLGLMIGIDLGEHGSAVSLAKAALRQGILVLPAGRRGHVVQLAPPADLTDPQADFAIDALCGLVEEVQ